MQDDMYKTAEATVVSGVILSIIFLMVELIILFSGLTIFNEPTNMLCSFFLLNISDYVPFYGMFINYLVYYYVMALLDYLVYMDSFLVI